MKRGDVWTVAAGGDHAGKPRPAVIVQDDRLDATASVTICAFTSDPTDAPLFRLVVEPSVENGLTVASRLMVDKITTVSKTKLGTRIGRISDEDTVRLNRAIWCSSDSQGERNPRSVESINGFDEVRRRNYDESPDRACRRGRLQRHHAADIRRRGVTRFSAGLWLAARLPPGGCSALSLRDWLKKVSFFQSDKNILHRVLALDPC